MSRANIAYLTVSHRKIKIHTWWLRWGLQLLQNDDKTEVHTLWWSWTWSESDIMNTMFRYSQTTKNRWMKSCIMRFSFTWKMQPLWQWYNIVATSCEWTKLSWLRLVKYATILPRDTTLMDAGIVALVQRDLVWLIYEESASCGG